MKKSKILNIALTSIMLLSTILTPQISYALGDNLNGKDAKESEQVEPEETADGNEAVVPSQASEDDGDGEADSAEVESTTTDNEAGDDNENTTVDGEVGSEEPGDTNINDPPADKVETGKTDEEDESDKKDEQVEEADESSLPTAFNETLEATDLGNIFTFISLKLGNEEIEDDSVIEIGDGTVIDLEYAWETEGLDAKAGDTASINLPDAFKQVNVQNQAIVAGGINVGTYSIIDGILEFVFNEGIEDGAVHSGYATLGLEFDLEKFQEDVRQEIHFNDQQDKTLTVIAKPTADVSGIIKEGHPDRDHDAREINWSVDVINDNNEPISGAQLKDSLPDGLGDPRDFVVTELSVGINGNKTPRNIVEVSPAINGNEFEINFDTISPYSGYRIEYTTTINDYTIDTFTNDAHFTYGDKNLPAKATVDKLTRSNPIEKDGIYNSETGQIDWVINVNESGGEIDEATVYDELPDELSLITDSITVEKFDDNWQWIGDVSLEKNEFPLNLGKVESNEIYHIRFSTNIDWIKVNDGEYQNYNEFINETELHDGEIPVGEDNATVGFDRESLIEKSGNAGDYNYEDKVLSWKIDVNKANHPIDNAVLTDILPAGLGTITAENITVEGAQVDPDDITITPNSDDGTQTVVINLGNIDNEVTVSYETEVENFEKNDFKNAASLGGDGIGEETPNDDVTVNPPGNAFNKDFTEINYNERTIEWEISVNPQREAITELTIEDTFLNNGMILLPETITVKISDTELVEGTDYTLEPNTVDEETGYNKGFTLDFININEDSPLNGPLTVEFKTSYDPQLEVEGNRLDPHTEIDEEHHEDLVYINYAQFTGKTVNGNDFDRNDDAETTVREDSWNSGKKEGQLVHVDSEDNLENGWVSGAERKIAWQVYTNYQQQNLGSDVSVTDTLKYKGEIDEDSIVVSVYDVEGDGKTEITDDILTLGEDYTVEVDNTVDVDNDDEDGANFTVNFSSEVRERYVIEFTTTVPNISQPNYTNNATVKVGDNDYPYSSTVHYDKHNNFLEKGPSGLEGNEVFTGDEVDWEVKVNESLSTILQDVEIVDTISAGLVYVNDSLEIFKLDGEEEVPLIEDEDYELDVQIDEETEETELTISILGDVEHTLLLRYTTVVSETDGQVNNTVEFNGTGIDNETVTSEKLNARQFSSVGGEFNPNRGAIRVNKIDEDNETIETGEATFELWYELNDERVQFVQDNAFTTENGVLEIGNLPLRTYYLSEVESPEGYVLSEEEIEIDVTESVRKHGVYEVDFENIAEIEIPVRKEWKDADNQDGIRPESITVNLLANGEETGESITLSANDWSATFTGLSPIDDDGDEIEYTIEEDEVEGYVTEDIAGNVDDGFTITNSYEPELIDLEGNKTWDDAGDQDGKRPESIIVNLLANGDEVDSVNVTDENDWNYEFSNLPKFENGEKINYTIEEDEVEEYSTEIDGMNITNSYTPEVTNVNVGKEWDDTDNQDGVRPNNITVNLLNGNEVVTQAVLNADNEWQHTFENLPVYEDGILLDYSVTEDSVAGYSTSSETTEIDEGLSSTIINSHTPGKTSATVTKAWDDGGNQDGNRSESVEVQLLADGEPEGDSVFLTAAENWTYTWNGLDEKSAGEAIEYTVEEIDVSEEYEVTVNNKDHGNLIIQNAYEPEVTELSVSKAWDDAEDQDGVRPDSVTVNLLGNNEVIRTTVLDDENDWNHTFSNLPVYADGEEINYRVTENTVADYSASIDEDSENANGFVITNSYTPEETTATVSKAWNDGDNQDGNRPTSIEIQLYADGTAVGEAVEVTASNDWTYTWTELDAYANGEAIDYSVEEINASEEYTVSVNDADHGNIIITNSYEPELTEVPALKVWEDTDNQDGERPSNIILNLLNDRGEIVKQAVVQEQEGNEWKYTFENLPKFENGEEIDYSVTEDFVSDYSTKVEENDERVQVVTNSYTPEETSVTVTKGWNDSNNQDGNRPSEIQVQLLADGEALGEVITLTTENWTHTWDELDLKADGIAIDYSVEEVDVPEGYTSSINDRDHGNIIITNNYNPELIEIPVQKIWDDANNQDGIRPERIEVNLLADGEKIREAHITEARDWQHVFTGLPRFKVGQEGQEVVYTLNENNVENYSLTGNEFNEETGNYELTNSYTPEETSVTVTKGWNDANNQDGNRPETIGVRVIANEVETEYVAILSAENNWTHTWEGLALNDAGTPIDYSVIETNVADEYDVTINDEDHGNVMITNSYTPKVTDITGEKIWDDAENQDGIRPESITVNLLADGVEVAEQVVTVNDEGNWNYVFANFPVYQPGEVGQEITYTVKEEAVEDYEVSYDGNNIVNRHEPKLTEVSGEKKWEDADNQDGVRPNEITVNLLANGEEIDNQVVTAEDGWSYTFDNLPVYQPGEVGQEIKYTVAEEAVEGYDVSYDEHNIINSYTPKVMDIEGTKIWDDADNQDGKRPDSIIVNLLSNGNKVDTVEVTEATDWEFEFTNLPKFENGEEINYTVQEDNVADYSTEIKGTEIINSYTPGKTSVNVVKSWKDEDNKDARPDSITVNLLADGEVVDSVKLNAENNWQADFIDLVEYKDGKLIDYTVEEIAVEGYESSVAGTSQDGFVITNTQKPEEPGDPDPKDPTEPSDPEEPTDPDKPEDPIDPEEPGDLDPEDPEDSDGNGLPITGEAATYIGLAITLLVAGIVLAYYERKSTN